MTETEYDDYQEPEIQPPTLPDPAEWNDDGDDQDDDQEQQPDDQDDGADASARLEEIAAEIESERERIIQQRREEGKTGRPPKSDRWRELEKEQKEIESGSWVRSKGIDPAAAYVPADNFAAEQIVDMCDTLLTAFIKPQHPHPETVPMTAKEKKMLRKPLGQVLAKHQVEMTPEAALVSAAIAIAIPRVIPVVMEKRKQRPGRKQPPQDAPGSNQD